MSVSKPSSICAALFFLFLLLFKLSICVGISSILIHCPEIEKQSLLRFKKSLHDPNNLLSSWNGEVNCCMWEGVFCSNLSGHVHALHLQSLSGKINPSLLNLKHLKYLDLSQNSFNETIPSFIGSITSLEYLNLSQAGFYGKIPHTIGNLSNLHTLSFEANFEGLYNVYSERLLDVDSLEWLLGLSKLEYLNLNFVKLSRATNWAQVINKLPSLLELHFSHCILNDFTPHHLNDVNITSNISILDLSWNNNFQYAASIPRWIFQLSNLVYLDLSYNFLEGSIPNISNITKLQHIDLSSNNINSSIPEWLYLNKHLEYVDLSENHLRNEISNSVSNLTSLDTLRLSSNEISGKIPGEIGSLCKMRTLDLSGNKLQGEVSDSFGNMSDCFLGALEYLDLSSNQLSGHLTPQFGEFKSLQSLDLSRNSISGVIPENKGNLSSLEYLNLGGNKLTGNLPESVGKLFNLKLLYINDNMMEGVVTEAHFANLSQLTLLSASRNHLTLKVSSNWIPPMKLYTLRMGSWNLGSGSRFPSWLETQKNNISGLDLSCTGISGNVPSWLWSIGYLNLSHNQLHGEIPIINGDSYHGVGQLVYLSSNKFSGPLPQLGNNVTELDLSNNSFSGDLSHFLCETMTTSGTTFGLTFLHLGGNHLSGELPDCFMKWPLVRVLNLRNNNLSGRIPNSIGFLEYVWSLNLYDNKFSGHIPFSMRNCTQLQKIDISDNDFDGNIPTWMGTSLSQLKFLILRSNKLSGEIPSTICQLSSLQILDLSHNKFSGILPSCVHNFTAMATKRSLLNSPYLFEEVGYINYWVAFIESASITTKGDQLHYDTILELVTSIDLSRNNLSGSIPEEITSLVELRSLNLSGNHLIGLIPDSIGNMKQMESLDFSLNSLSGEMPNSFTVMSSLNYLNLSFNNLTGRIPQSTQIRGFKESSFIGNNLCGPPLTSSCGNIDGEAPAGSTQKEDGEGEKAEIEWIYVFTSLGFAVGLSATLTTLFLNKSWLEACYYFLENMWDNFYAYCSVRWTRLTRALG